MRFKQTLKLAGHLAAKRVSERIVELATEPTIAPDYFEGDSEVIQHEGRSHASITSARDESEIGELDYVAPVSVFLPGEEEDEYTIISYEFPSEAFDGGSEKFVAILTEVLDKSLNEEEFDLREYFERS